MENIHKILIFRLSSIGDIILSTPLVRCVKKRFPKAELHFLIKTEFAAVMENNPHISKLWQYNKKTGQSGLRQLKNDLKAENFDWIIDIHRNLRTSYLKRFLKAKFHTSYSKQILARTMLVYFGINIYKENKLVINRYFEAVEKQGVFYDNAGTEVFFKEVELNFVRMHLQKENIEEGFVTICPAASFLNKRWLPERFALLADKIAEKYKKRIVLLGGKNDIDLCQEIISKMQTSALNMAGKCQLTASAALLNLSGLVISNDSGMMHLAQSQKRPVVGIFGPTTIQLGYFPIPQNSVVVETPLKCRPCTHNGYNHCPKKHFNCMKNISVEQVFHACEQFL